MQRRNFLKALSTATLAAPLLGILASRLVPATQRAGAQATQLSNTGAERVRTMFVHFGRMPEYADGLALSLTDDLVTGVTNRSGRIVQFGGMLMQPNTSMYFNPGIVPPGRITATASTVEATLRQWMPVETVFNSLRAIERVWMYSGYVTP